MSLAPDISRRFVVSQPDEPRVSQVIVRGPFEKLDLGRTPASATARRPSSRGEPLSPAAPSRLRQIRKRTGTRLKPLELREQGGSGCRRESVSGACDIEQLTVLVDAEDERVEGL